MKTVIQNAKRIEVPDNFIECTVCGVWCDPSEFRRENETHQSRTNCFACYNLDWDIFQLKKEERILMLKSPEHKREIRALREELEYMSNAVSVETLIAQLQALPKNSFVRIAGVDFTAPQLDRVLNNRDYYDIGCNCGEEY